MAIEFRSIEPKTGELLVSVPNRVAEHTYLEHRLKQAQAAGTLPEDVKLYVAKLYESVSEADLVHLRDKQNLHTIGSNRRSGYLAEDSATAAWVKSEIFTNFSDQVAYFSVAMSHAVSSTVQPNARVLVMDDGEPADAAPAKKWGRRKAKDRAGHAIDPTLLAQAHQMLGDGYCLVSPDLHRQVSRSHAVELAHQAVDAGKLAIAQVYPLAGVEVGQWDLTQVREALMFHTEETIGRSLPVDEAQLLSAGALAQMQSPFQLSTPRLTSDPIRGEVATAKWRYTDLAGNVTYTGQVMLEQRPTDRALKLTIIGGNQKQKQVVAQTFDAIATADLTPFQLRGGVPEWKGAFKGTSRAASICGALGVDVVLPKSAIKADGKTTPLGISKVSELFWARKSDARAGQQRLGTQVLVNLPAGTKADILPKLQSTQEALVEAMRDPRKLADLYCEAYERRQRFAEQQDGFEDEASSKTAQNSDFKPAQNKATRTDWLYTLLKADARPSDAVVLFDSQAWLKAQFPELEPERLARWQHQLQGVETELSQSVISPKDFRQLLADTLQLEPREVGDISPYVETVAVGGYAQLLEMPKVVDRLYDFTQAEWKDSATGGVTIPSATAQPHALLNRGEVCFAGMPHGARISGYRAPLANIGQAKVLVNNLALLRDNDPEAFIQQGVVYLNPDDAKEMVIDFDIDSVGLVPDEEYVRAKAISAPVTALSSDQCYVPTLPAGQAVTLYHRDQVVSLVNTPIALPEDVPKSSRAIYLSQDQYAAVDPRQPLSYGFYDGQHGFKSLNDEIDYLTQPERRPAPVEKRTKIPRDASHPDVVKLTPEERVIAESFTSLEQAIIHAADNPTGKVANAGMILQALKQHLDASDQAVQIQQVVQASERFHQLLSQEGIESETRQTFRVPNDFSDGYSVRAAMEEIAAVAPADSKCNKLLAQLQQQNDADLLITLSRARGQFVRVMQGNTDQGIPVYPERRPGEYDFKAEAEWIRDSARYLTATTNEGKAAQARRVVVPRLAQFLSQLDRLPDDYHKQLKQPFTNYQRADEVKGYKLNRPGQAEAALKAVPTLKKLLEVTQHRLLDSELQSAVETDKSARPVNADIFNFAQALSTYQPVNWVHEKKNPLLFKADVDLKTGQVRANPVPDHNTADPVGQMVEQATRYYQQVEVLHSQDLKAYNGMVPRLGTDAKDLHRSARSIATEYNRMIAQATELQEQAKLNPGPKLTLQVEGVPVPLTVTNLSCFNPEGNSPVWQYIREGQPFTVQILPNEGLQGIAPKDSKVGQTQSWGNRLATHEYQVVGLFPDGQGQMVAYSIGTLNAETERALGAHRLSVEAIAGRALEMGDLKLEPNYDQNHADELITQAEANVVLWAESMSVTPESREAAFRSLYHADFDLEANQHTTGTNGRYLALKLFPDQMLPYVQNFSLTTSKVTGLNHNAHKLGEDVRWQGQAVPVRTAVMDDPRDPIHGRVVWQVGIDKPFFDQGYRREWYTIGTANQNNVESKSNREEDYRLPIGVEAVAQITAISPRYGMKAEDGTLLTMTPMEVNRHYLDQHDPSQPINLRIGSPSVSSKLCPVVYRPNGGGIEDEVQVGRLSLEDSKRVNGKPTKPHNYFLEALPTQAATMSILPQSVQRLDPELWAAPTIKNWQSFVQAQAEMEQPLLEQPAYPREVVAGRTPAKQEAMQLSTGRGEAGGDAGARVDEVMDGATAAPTPALVTVQQEQAQRPAAGKAAQPQPESVVAAVPQPIAPASAPEPTAIPTPPNPQEQYRQRYLAVVETISPSLQQVEATVGKLSDEQRDRAVAIYLLKSAARTNPTINLATDPANVEVIRTLWQSPHSQALAQSQGRQAMCKVISGKKVTEW